MEIAQSTSTAQAIGKLVEARYPLGPVVDAEFLRRSFNQVYRLTFASGQRVVARLSAERPRGPANSAFEAAVLAHWHACGCPVSRCLPTSSGAVALAVALPEGERPLMLFDFFDGEFTGEALPDVAAFGRGLADLHRAGQSYQGVPSLYALDLAHLLMRPLQGLLQATTVTAELRSPFEALAQRLRSRIEALGPLAQVLAHGDAHGQNNFVVDGPVGQRQAVFFDFDDAGPGYLAYELAVYAWAMHPHTVDGEMSDKARECWRHFLSTYCERGALSEADRAAIPLFMAVRHIWLLGEYAGRVPVWGTQAMPTDYLRRQLQVLTRWENLTLPV